MHEKFDGGALRRSRFAKPSVEEWLVFLAFLLPLLIAFLGVWIASQPPPPLPPINITKEQYNEALTRWRSHSIREYEEVIEHKGFKWRLVVRAQGQGDV